MASEDSSFDLQSLLADAQDLVDESLVAQTLLQPDTTPWERFPLALLYPTEEPFNEIHYSLFCDPPADSLTATEPTIKTEPAEDTPLLQPITEYPCEHAVTDCLFFTHDALSYDTSHSPASLSPSSSPTETAPLLQPEPELAEYLCFPDQVDYPMITLTTDDASSPSVADTSPIATTSFNPPWFTSTSFAALTASPPATIASPRSSSFGSSFASIAIPSNSTYELSSSNVPSIVTELEDVPCSSVNSKDVAQDEPVHYTFVDPHEKPRKRRAKGVKNSTPIACTFCRRRKIRCGGPQEGGVCKSCIRLNHKGDCIFPAVSYRGQRLGGSNSKRKSTSKSKNTGQCALPPSKSSCTSATLSTIQNECRTVAL